MPKITKKEQWFPELSSIFKEIILKDSNFLLLTGLPDWQLKDSKDTVHQDLQDIH